MALAALLGGEKADVRDDLIFHGGGPKRRVEAVRYYVRQKAKRRGEVNGDEDEGVGDETERGRVRQKTPVRPDDHPLEVEDREKGEAGGDVPGDARREVVAEIGYPEQHPGEEDDDDGDENVAGDAVDLEGETVGFAVVAAAETDDLRADGDFGGAQGYIT